MDATRFDSITRLFADRKTRRAAVGGGLGLAATAIAPLFARVAAQDATPAAAGGGSTPAAAGGDSTHPNATTKNVTELFTQAFASGTWEQASGDTYTLTLTGVAAHTIYFSDRPARLFGLTPMSDFITSLDAEPTDPPNAALITQDPDSGDEDILLVVLENPAYDAATSTLTYDATVLTDYQQGGLSSAAIRQQDYDFPASFGQGGLFIDDFCPRMWLTCYVSENSSLDPGAALGSWEVDRCWNFLKFECEDCYSQVEECHSLWGGDKCGLPGSGLECTASERPEE